MPPLLKKLALSLGTLLVLLTLIELVLRRIYPAEIPFLRYDHELITTLIPGGRQVKRLSVQDGGGWVVSTINSAGFRGPELRDETPDGRIYVAGDSFVHGYYSRHEESFVGRLAGELRARTGRDIELVNGGVAGYGPDQTLVRLRQHIDELKPDLVLLCLCCDNDFGDLLRNKMFELDEDGTLRKREYVIPDDWFAKFERAEAQRNASRGTLALFRTIRDLTRGAQELVDGEEVQIGIAIDDWLERRRKEYREYLRPTPKLRYGACDTWDADLALQPGIASSRTKRELMAAILAEFARTCAERDIPLVLMPIPSSMDVCRRYAHHVDREAWPQYRPEGLTSTYVAMAAQLELPCLDLFPIFDETGGDSLYFQGGDEHWNPAGQALAARAMADFLVESELLDWL